MNTPVRWLKSLSPRSILAVPLLIGAALLAPIDSSRTAGLLGATAACAAEGSWGCLFEALDIFGDNMDNCTGTLACSFQCSDDGSEVDDWSCDCYE